MSDPIPTAVPSAAARSGELPRRAAVTAAAVALLFAGARLPLPGVDPSALEPYGDALSPLALGLWPFLVAHVFIELVAAVVPAWAPLRHRGSPGRRRLARAAWATALLLAAWQGFGHALGLQGMLAPSGWAMLADGVLPALGVTAALVGGSLALALAAVVVSRHGLGNGFAVLVAAGAVPGLLRAAWSAAAGAPFASDAAVVAALALAVIVPLAAARLRRDAPPTVPAPTCGLVVLAAPAFALDSVDRLAALYPPLLPAAAALRAEHWAGVAGDVAFTLAMAVLFARAFNPPDDVVEAHAVATGSSGAEVRTALSGANRRSLLLVLALALVPTAAALLGAEPVPHVSAILAAATLFATALDLADEAAARVRLGPLAAAWPLHRVYLAAPVVAALEAAGIPAHARARRFRALFHLFAPFAPIDVLVPAERVREAEAVCARFAR